jgi:hypothetical protein
MSRDVLLDRADAIDDLPGLIKFEKVAIRMRAHQELNL